MKLLHPENRNCIPTAFVDFFFPPVGRIQCYGSVYVETLREGRALVPPQRPELTLELGDARRVRLSQRVPPHGAAELFGKRVVRVFWEPEGKRRRRRRLFRFSVCEPRRPAAPLPAAPPPRPRARARGGRLGTGPGAPGVGGRERNESRREPRELSDRASPETRAPRARARRAPRASTFVTPFPSRVFSVSRRPRRGSR